jgi:AraC-like DNA-binding protein
MADPLILLAHPGDEMRAFLRAHLTDRCRVRAVADGAAARTQLHEAAPDLLIVDAQVETPDGGALYRHVCEGPDRPAVPVVLMAADPPGGDDAAGPDAVLRKPFTADALTQCVRRHLPGALPVSDEAHPDALLPAARRIVEQRLHDPSFVVDDLAAALSLSRRHLTRRLKEEADTTPAALIRARRIERAKAELETNPDTIRDVAAAAGFRSASHFSQAFREAVGCPPSTYRARHAE